MIMKRVLFILAIISFCFVSCGKGDTLEISSEIYHLVQELKPTSVDEFLYNSEKVYHFDTWRGPDDFTCLYSRDGELMAYFGGFSGHGDGRCPDFYNTAEFIRTIYADGKWIQDK